MGRAINMENDLYKLEAEVETLKQRIDLIERAIQAGIKKPAKKHFEKKRDENKKKALEESAKKQVEETKDAWDRRP